MLSKPGHLIAQLLQKSLLIPLSIAIKWPLQSSHTNATVDWICEIECLNDAAAWLRGLSCEQWSHWIEYRPEKKIICWVIRSNCEIVKLFLKSSQSTSQSQKSSLPTKWREWSIERKGEEDRTTAKTGPLEQRQSTRVLSQRKSPPRWRSVTRWKPGSLRICRRRHQRSRIERGCHAVVDSGGKRTEGSWSETRGP